MGSTPTNPDRGQDPAPVGFGRLPASLLPEIASHLVLEDFLACAQVSRGWHAAWTQPSTTAALCRRFFPTLPHPHTLSSFRRACRTFFRRRHGKHTAVIDVSWQDWEAQKPCPFEFDLSAYREQPWSRDQLGDRPGVVAYGGGMSSGMMVVLMSSSITCKSLLVVATQFRSVTTEEIAFYHLVTDVEVKYRLPDSKASSLQQAQSVRTWGDRVFVASNLSKIHVFSHDGVNLSVTHVIDLLGDLPPSLRTFMCTGREPPPKPSFLKIPKFDPPPLKQYLPNFLPHPHDPDGVFIAFGGSISEFGNDVLLVREFSGTTHIATFQFPVLDTMRSVMESVLGRDNEFFESELAQAKARIRGESTQWWDNDIWPGIYSSDEGLNHVQYHDQEMGVRRVFINDGDDMVGDEQGEWSPRASVFRNQQFLRVYYDNYEAVDSRPVITTRDVDVEAGGWERTRRALEKRDDLYPLNFSNKVWDDSWDREIEIGLACDEDFTVWWVEREGDYVAFDFREPEEQESRQIDS
ncbi:unnamed protein product [Parascedosporium putredinis]|uniref:F-box domain-containing protein n=1 Tax=Parascedosporium putredinis TaxID=1442378 RepID=A0A9P1HDF9_9PEZI|nr:unnamed protein product [Parascedosporium putredinis]CAI8004249.1 unnamed protein product [Parascedosporium putredinis]